MTDLRRAKVESVADFIPDQTIDNGVDHGLAVVGWGSTYGTVAQAVREALNEGLNVGHVHIRHLNPLPKNLGELLARFDRVLVPELNDGQLATLLRDKLLLDVTQLNKVTGQPLTVSEVKAQIQALAPRNIREATNE
jgi:2-oxoglutarate ferredoxin oxidoreductase subunit alpha